MSTLLRSLSLLLVAASVMLASANGQDGQVAERVIQKYEQNGWKPGPDNAYYYIGYYFSKNNEPEKHHYLVYYHNSENPEYNQYYYIYNPEARTRPANNQDAETTEPGNNVYAQNQKLGAYWCRVRIKSFKGIADNTDAKRWQVISTEDRNRPETETIEASVKAGLYPKEFTIPPVPFGPGVTTTVKMTEPPDFNFAR